MAKELKKLKHDLLTEKYTQVWHEKDFKFNAPHHFRVLRPLSDEEAKDGDGAAFECLAKIDFQEGPIKENGVNGVNNEDLIAMVITRLEGFQNSEFNCRDNAIAITHLEDALLRLRKRTMGRENRGVEGTHQK